MADPFHPLVSIVIPVYNGANYMRQAIDSALAQTYDRVEVVVVNDGARDDGATEQIARSYGDRIRYFAKPNGGVATALNYGIERMTGEYFSWLSHDDVYQPAKVAAQVALLAARAERDVIVYSDYATIDSAGRHLGEVKVGDIPPLQLVYRLVIERKLHGCTLLIPRRAFAQAGLFPVDLPTTQDYTLWLRMTKTHAFVYCPHSLVLSRVHPVQGSRTLQHTDEAHGFYRRELYHFAPDRMAAMFPAPAEEAAAWQLLLTLFRTLNFTDCYVTVANYASQRLGPVAVARIAGRIGYAPQVRAVRAVVLGLLGLGLPARVEGPFRTGVMAPPQPEHAAALTALLGCLPPDRQVALTLPAAPVITGGAAPGLGRWLANGRRAWATLGRARALAAQARRTGSHLLLVGPGDAYALPAAFLASRLAPTRFAVYLATDDHAVPEAVAGECAWSAWWTPRCLRAAESVLAATPTLATAVQQRHRLPEVTVLTPADTAQIMLRGGGGAE